MASGSSYTNRMRDSEISQKRGTLETPRKITIQIKSYRETVSSKNHTSDDYEVIQEASVIPKYGQKSRLKGSLNVKITMG